MPKDIAFIQNDCKGTLRKFIEKEARTLGKKSAKNLIKKDNK